MLEPVVGAVLGLTAGLSLGRQEVPGATRLEFFPVARGRSAVAVGAVGLPGGQRCRCGPRTCRPRTPRRSWPSWWAGSRREPGRRGQPAGQGAGQVGSQLHGAHDHDPGRHHGSATAAGKVPPGAGPPPGLGGQRPRVGPPIGEASRGHSRALRDAPPGGRPSWYTSARRPGRSAPRRRACAGAGSASSVPVSQTASPPVSRR